MTHVEQGYHSYSYIDGKHSVFAENIELHNASRESVLTVLSADEHDLDGRSQFVWIRFPDATLALAVFPQGETYFDVEGDAS